MSSGNLVQVSVRKEATWGSVDAGNGEIIRRTGGSFDAGTQSTRSAEVKTNRRISAVRNTGFRPTGDFQVEMPYDSHATLQEAALMSTYGAAANSGALTDVTPATGPNTFTRAAGSWLTDGFAVGDWVLFSGWTGGLVANNRLFKITALTATVMTVAQTVTAGASGDSVTCKHNGVLTDGNTFTSLSVEEMYDDAGGAGTDYFMSYLGAVLGGMGLSLQPSSLITGSFSGILARSVDRPASSIFAGYDAANTNTPMDAVTDISLFEVGDADPSYLIAGFDLSLDNGLNGNEAIRQAELGEITLGSTVITGSYNVYWGANAQLLVDDHLAQVATSFAFAAQDAAGNYVIIDLPLVEWTGGVPAATEQNGQVLSNMTWEAIEDPVSGAAFRIIRISA